MSQGLLEVREFEKTGLNGDFTCKTYQVLASKDKGNIIDK